MISHRNILIIYILRYLQLDFEMVQYNRLYALSAIVQYIIFQNIYTV
jgi:hypothetical protein